MARLIDHTAKYRIRVDDFITGLYYEIGLSNRKLSPTATDSTTFNQLTNLLRMAELREPRAVLGEAELTVGSNMGLFSIG